MSKEKFIFKVNAGLLKKLETPSNLNALTEADVNGAILSLVYASVQDQEEGEKPFTELEELENTTLIFHSSKTGKEVKTSLRSIMFSDVIQSNETVAKAKTVHTKAVKDGKTQTLLDLLTADSEDNKVWELPIEFKVLKVTKSTYKKAKKDDPVIYRYPVFSYAKFQKAIELQGDDIDLGKLFKNRKLMRSLKGDEAAEGYEDRTPLIKMVYQIKPF